MTPDIIDQLAEAIARHTAMRIPLAIFTAYYGLICNQSDEFGRKSINA